MEGKIGGEFPPGDGFGVFGKPVLTAELRIVGSVTNRKCVINAKESDCGELSPGNPGFTMTWTGQLDSSSGLGGIQIAGGTELPETVLKGRYVNPFSGTWRLQKCRELKPNSLEVNPEPCLARVKAQLPPWQYKQKQNVELAGPSRALPLSEGRCWRRIGSH